ncbi:hypothetical protein [Gynuella sp.]|uniref:hypothetical protein n=1 Tax=Gynuella sp. TaxID=2969146 RepID=UPI003D149C4A
MNTRLLPLFTLHIRHEYYQGNCPDFSFLIPAQSAQQAQQGRIIFRQKDHVLYALYTANNDALPISPLNNATLLIGLQLNNPNFSNFTDVDISAGTLLYQNTTDTSLLDSAIPITLCSHLLRHTLTFSERPNQITLKLSDETVLAVTNCSTGDTHNDVDFELSRLQVSEGRLRITESTPGDSSDHDYFYAPELFRSGIFALVEIQITADSYNNASTYQIDFSAKNDILKYYVVANHYSDTEFNSLSVTDTGFNEDGRSEIVFNPVLPAAFSSDDIHAELLADDDQHLVVFKSNSVQKRQQTPRKHIQLNLNGEVLIADLPSASQEKTQPSFVIQLEKP